jgi:ABC-2 type transport system ATP-binding protein
VGLQAEAARVCNTYTSGQKQRLGLGAALLTNPEMLVLDEPTGGLDPEGVGQLRSLMGNLALHGVTIILCTHALKDIGEVLTRVAIMKQGIALVHGAVTDLLATNGGVLLGFDHPEWAPLAIRVLQDAAAGQVPWLQGVEYVRIGRSTASPSTERLLLLGVPFERAGEINALLAGQDIYAAELRPHEVTLEQFYHLTVKDEPPGEWLDTTVDQPVLSRQAGSPVVRVPSARSGGR